MKLNVLNYFPKLRLKLSLRHLRDGHLRSSNDHKMDHPMQEGEGKKNQQKDNSILIKKSKSKSLS